MTVLATEFLALLEGWHVAAGARTSGGGGEHAAALLAAAEKLLAEGGSDESQLWQAYLEATGRPDYLSALPDRAARQRWAQTTFAAIRLAGHDLADMLAARAREHPERPFLQEQTDSGPRRWSYRQVRERTRAIAAALLRLQPRAPRVAILAENCLEGACVDLACLQHGIFVSPLDVHFHADVLAGIFTRLGVEVAVVDSDERRSRLEAVRTLAPRPFTILHLDPAGRLTGRDDRPLAELRSRLADDEIETTLAARPRPRLDAVATAMFTSGSTGQPKGVCFSLYNLVTKRYARAAALPRVGRDEVLLCYLPLYHTFGRFLELQGALYWRGMYVFAGNPSAETLLTLLRQVRPTALIGIPLRWQQIRERCQAVLLEATGEQGREAAVREIIGDRLRWGLSAAGYLDPKIFLFFQRHGVDLCSGFGMTEATGGITMTPPGAYRENSVGLPLPGVRVRFGADGQLHIAAPYLARYLDDLQPPAPAQAPAPPPAPTEAGAAEAGAAEPVPLPDLPPADDHWLATGDLFEQDEDGYLSIVDRIKDIYKNSKGQTIAPRRVEQKFVEVPGVKRAFLVGDGRAYNVLLIVPDRDDPIIRDAPSPESVRHYCRQLIAAANRELAAYERVVNFALLERDFELARGELTPKGTFRRKQIEANFAARIGELYQTDHVLLEAAGVRVRIPRWFYRDLGILEDEVVVEADGLRDLESGRALPLGRTPDGRVRVGDLEYRATDGTVDLGLFARQPLLWIGNASLAAFCPCKEGWDLPLGPVGADVWLPWRAADAAPAPPPETCPHVRDQRLADLHRLAVRMLFAAADDALVAVATAEGLLRQADDRLGRALRRRLEALARHPELRVRCLAYRLLLLDEPVPDYSRVLPAFVQSGLPFLSEESIEAIARANLEQRRLEALRQRLHGYRRQLAWPAAPATRSVFADIFKLLANFARYQPAYYGPVREELACWLLHRADPELARLARRHFDQLAAWFEANLEAHTPHNAPQDWTGKIVFQEDLSPAEVRRLEAALVGTTFLKQSLLLACDGETFDLREIPADGIWISRILSFLPYQRYRASINTRSGKHHDLQIIVREDISQEPVLETIHWMVAIAGYPFGAPIVPKFGCCRPELGAYSLGYLSDLTVWEKIREFSSVREPGGRFPTGGAWRKLFVRAMAAPIIGWRNSGGQIVPGAATPTNIVVPEPDFREGATIISLTGWRPYRNTLSLVAPLLRNFYQQTAAHYPWCQPQLEARWIFDAVIEALGVAEGRLFLADLRRDLAREPIPGDCYAFAEALDQHLQGLQERYHVPLAVRCAIDRYLAWAEANPGATPSACDELLSELLRLYRLDRYPEIARYHLYRHTYFAAAEPDVRAAADRLLAELFRRPDRPATHLVELSDLQALLTSVADRALFARLVFPHARPAQQVEVLAVGAGGQRQVIVRSQITDRRGGGYEVREPLGPAEIGLVYRLFYRAGFPKTISEQDRYFVAADQAGEIVGGICYKNPDAAVAHLDGIVVAGSLRGRGLSTALLEDLCLRLTGQGVRVLKTHFFLRHFYLRHGFQVDPRWGGLVRFLAP